MGLAQVFIISIWVMAIRVETGVEDERGCLISLRYLHYSFVESPKKFQHHLPNITWSNYSPPEMGKIFDPKVVCVTDYSSYTGLKLL